MRQTIFLLSDLRFHTLRQYLPSSYLIWTVIDQPYSVSPTQAYHKPKISNSVDSYPHHHFTALIPHPPHRCPAMVTKICDYSDPDTYKCEIKDPSSTWSNPRWFCFHFRSLRRKSTDLPQEIDKKVGLWYLRSWRSESSLTSLKVPNLRLRRPPLRSTSLRQETQGGMRPQRPL